MEENILTYKHLAWTNNPTQLPTFSPSDSPIPGNCERYRINQSCLNQPEETCDEKLFIGNVTEIITSKIVHNDSDVCICQYIVEICGLDPTEETIGTCTDQACQDGLSSGDICREIHIEPCCSYINYDDKYQGMVPILSDNNEAINWTCNNSYNYELCPDIFDGERYYATEHKISWFYEMDEDKIISTCGCKYFVNECVFPPTHSPTPGPTDNTASPTATPSINPSQPSFVEKSLCIYVANNLQSFHSNHQNIYSKQ